MKQPWLKATGVLILLAGTALAGAQTSAMVKDDLFNGTEKFAKGASDITEITMDPQTLKMVDGKSADKARHTVLNVVRTYTYDKPGMYNIADVEEFRNKLNTGEWHCSVHTRDMKRGESTDICNRSRTDGLVETAIITVEPKELTFIHTIKQPGAGGWPGGMSSAYMPFDAEAKAQMAVAQAEMKAQMAAIEPQIKAQIAAAIPRINVQPNVFANGVYSKDFVMPDFSIYGLKDKLTTEKDKDKDKDKTKQPE